MNLSIEGSLPTITGPDEDVATAFLGRAPVRVPTDPSTGTNIYSASGEARQIAGNVITTFTGPVERLELHVADTVSNNLGLSKTVASVTKIYDQVVEVLQSNYEDLSLSIEDDPYEGTCAWILEHQTYTHWEDEPNSDFLWLCGPPGCGKTTMSSFLLRHWREKLQEPYTIVHFFFSRQVEKATTPQNFLAALLHQILLLYPITHSFLKELPGLKAMQSVASLTTSQEGLWNVLNQILMALHSVPDPGQQKPILCIIDALEECADNSNMQFLRRLHKGLRTTPFQIKVLVTCRRDYMEQLPPFVSANDTISVDEGNFRDIYTYVTGHLRVWSQTASNSEVLSKLEIAITSRAEGIFLWAALVVEGLLQRGTHLQTVLKTIHNFPRGRDEKLRKVYEEILKRASSSLKDENSIADIRSILNVVITAAKPLTLQELEECLESGETGSQHLDLEYDIKRTCRGLLKIDGNYVRPFHITLKAYLESAAECLPQFYVNQDNRHIRLAESCLTYAVDRIGLASSHDSAELETIIGDNAFLTYAATQWPFHVKGSGVLHQKLVELIRDLLGDTRRFRKWYAIILNSDSKLRQQIYAFRMICGEFSDLSLLRPKPAHILSLIGLSRPWFAAIFQSDTIDTFSERALGPDNEDAQGRTPAHWASGFWQGFLDPAISQADLSVLAYTPSIQSLQKFRNSEAISHILNIFPNSSRSRDQTGKTPLHLACSSPDTRKVQALIDAKADVQLQDTLGFSALHYCCGPLNLDNAKVLISHKAKLDVKTNEGLTPLHIAAIHGQEQTVKLLLDHGANVADEDKHGMTSLLHAVRHPNNYAQMIVSHMRRNGLLDAAEDEYMSSIFSSFPVVEKTIKRLIAAGADLEHRSNSGETALYMAAYEGHLQSLQILMSAKARLDVQNINGWAPLFAAAVMGRELVVEALIDAKVDISLCDIEGSTPLHAAAQTGHRKVVTHLVKAGADVNAVDKNGWTPLHMAAATNVSPIVTSAALRQGVNPETIPYLIARRARKLEAVLMEHEGIVKDLLTEKADISAASSENLTVLHIAALHGHEPILRILIEHGADINAVNIFGVTAAYVAALSGNDSCLRTLLEEGASMTTITTEDTPLHAAAAMGHESTMNILIDAGADLDCVNEDGLSPLHGIICYDQKDYIGAKPVTEAQAGRINIDPVEAVLVLAQKNRTWEELEEGQKKCVESLLSRKANVNVTSNKGRTPLLIAAGLGRESMVRILLEHGADSAISDCTNNTPLLYAIYGGYVEVITLLLEFGADINAIGRRSPLLAAVAEDRLDIVELLLKKGADISVVENDGWTPLLTAIDVKNSEMVKMLLDNGADVSVAVDGWTPLNMAINSVQVAVANMLLDEGADASACAPDGWSPLLGAIHTGRLEMVQKLLANHAGMQCLRETGMTPLHKAAKSGQVEIVELLLQQAGVDINATNIVKRTPLHHAAIGGHYQIAKTLLENAADLSITDNDGWNALHSAAHGGHVEIVRSLLEFQADVNIAIKEGWFPIHLAACVGATDVVSLLLHKGVDPNLRGPQGRTPFSFAAGFGNVELMQILLNENASLDSRDDFGRTVLHDAAREGRSIATKWLVAQEVEIDPVDKNGRTPLLDAVQYGDKDIIQVLLDAKANIGVRMIDGLTSQHIAVRADRLEILQLLEKKGALLGVTCDRGRTLLHDAATKSDCAILEFLLRERNQSPAVYDHLRISPLHEAVYRRNLSAVELLMQAHADPEQLDGYGRSCLDWAEPYPAMFYILFRGAVEYKRTPQDVTKKHALESVRMLLKKDNEGIEIEFHQLGHCFIRLGEDNAASASFEQQIFEGTDVEALKHSVICDACGQVDIVGRRYVCTECAEVDLCDPCMKTYEEKSSVPGCKTHRFLKIPRPSWKPYNPTDGNDLDPEARRKALLASLKEKYL